MYLSTNLCRLTTQVIPSDFEKECQISNDTSK